MAKCWLCSLCVVGLACGPSVPSTGGDGSGSPGDGSSSSGAASDTTSPSSTTTALSGSSSGSNGSTDASGSTSAADTGIEPVELCLQGAPQPAIDDRGSLLRVVDTDGNGRDEVWMSQDRWDPLEELQSSVLRPFELDDRGVFVALTEVELPGKVEALADIDGDGLLDAVLTQWNESAPWWQAGLPGFDIDATALPLEGLDLSGQGIWMEVTGDDTADYIEQSESGFQVLVGQSTGTFAPAGASALEGYSPYFAIPAPTLGQLVLLFQEPALGFATDDSIVRTVAVDANGDLQTLAESGPLDIGPDFVGDLDGDGIADVIGVDAIESNTLRFLGSAQGPYEEVDIVTNVRGALVGEFVQQGDSEILWWDTNPQWQLRRSDGAAWTEEVPVVGSRQWDLNEQGRVIEANGEPGAEVLLGRETFSLWSVEPC